MWSTQEIKIAVEERERLMNNEADGEAVVTSKGIEVGRGRVSILREICRVEVEKTILRLKCGKGAGLDGITVGGGTMYW